MNNLRIKRLIAENFKGFPKLDIQFTGIAIILGGMNGYGKTTIFDAIELLFTGSIKRLAQYSETLHNHQYKRSQNQLPLVCDMSCDTVSITAFLEINGENVQIKRSAKVAEMKNPVKFTPFSIMQIYNPEAKQYHNISKEEIEKYGLDDIKKDFCFLNYLSQEEATAFLKCKENERSNMIQDLFETEHFDKPIDKTDVIVKSIDALLKDYSSKESNIDREIKQLQQAVSSSTSSSEYISLSNNQAVWDAEEPKMTFEEFNSWAAENGIIDNLKYYIDNEVSFKHHNRNNIINKLLSDNVLNNVVFYQKNKDKEALFLSYSTYQKSLREPVSNLTSDTLPTLKLGSQNIPNNVIADDTCQQANRMIKGYLDSLNSANNIQKMVQDLLEARTSFADKIEKSNQILIQTKCPLCGSEYDTPDDLCETIKRYEKELNDNFALLNKGLGEQFAHIKSFLTERIVKPIEMYFESQGVTEQLTNRYLQIDRAATIKDINMLTQLGVIYDISKTEFDCVSEIDSELKAMIVPIDSSIDITLLQKTYSSFVKDIDKDKLTKDNLEKKRAYLISQWNKLQSVLLEKKREELGVISIYIKGLDEKKSDLKKIKDQIKKQRDQYVTSIIKDIQVLFYIYSGRILQDSYFGRGLFIKPDIERKRVLFVYGNYKDSDVDALYNMSSGQLVAVAIAFMLSLNRLYSTNNMIAIDDPVQTIDDINLWGLMETLRHDFKKHFIFLSTHESNYGQLLDYKFRKIGMQSEYIDMADLHRN